MDLLKEETRLVDKKHKALENLERKKKYLAGAAKSFKKARREFRLAANELKVVRKKIVAEGIERPVITPDTKPEAVENKPAATEETTD